jgi:hypothetical protein
MPIDGKQFFVESQWQKVFFRKEGLFFEIWLKN